MYNPTLDYFSQHQFATCTHVYVSLIAMEIYTVLRNQYIEYLKTFIVTSTAIHS